MTSSGRCYVYLQFWPMGYLSIHEDFWISPKIFFRFFAFINFFLESQKQGKACFDGFLRTKFNVLLQGNCLGLKDTPRGTLGRVWTISNVSKLAAILVAFSTVFPISRAFCRLNISDCRWLTLTSDSHREEEMIPVSLQRSASKWRETAMWQTGAIFDHSATIFS